MDKLIEGILFRLRAEKLIDEEYVYVYQFGLECMLLKFIHVVSYLLIGLCTGELISLSVSGIVIIPLRRKVGGYHAKKRIGCYIFSCCIVFLLCMLNKAIVTHAYRVIGVIIADILLVRFAPVENENRKLKLNEKNLFRKQAIGGLIMIHIIIAVILTSNRYLLAAYWLENGVILTGLLLFLGVKTMNKEAGN